MGAAPLSWLAKIGGDTLKTKAKLLSSAINELYDDGQCKIVAVVDNTEDNGKTVLITTDDNKTYSGTIANKKCEFLLPPKTLYTVQKVSSGSAEFTTKVEAGYGDCILVHLDTGYVEVKQGDIVGLDYIKAATADDLKNKVPEANAVKELNGKLGKMFEFGGSAQKLRVEVDFNNNNQTAFQVYAGGTTFFRVEFMTTGIIYKVSTDSGKNWTTMLSK